MRLLVCGSRDYTNAQKLCQVLDAFHAQHPVDVLIEGEAPGADILARRWAESRGILVDPYPADWQGKGRAAGPVRNRKMLKKGQPHHVIAFPVGTLSQSHGTKDMVLIARAAGVRAVVVGVDDVGVISRLVKENR